MAHGKAPEQRSFVLGDDRTVRGTLQPCPDVSGHGLLAGAIHEDTERDRGLSARVDVFQLLEFVKRSRRHLPRGSIQASLLKRDGNAGPGDRALVGRLDECGKGACRVGILAGYLACARCEKSAPLAVIDQGLYDRARFDRGERVDAWGLDAIHHGQLPLEDRVIADHSHDGHLTHAGRSHTGHHRHEVFLGNLAHARHT